MGSPQTRAAVCYYSLLQLFRSSTTGFTIWSRNCWNQQKKKEEKTFPVQENVKKQTEDVFTLLNQRSCRHYITINYISCYMESSCYVLCNNGVISCTAQHETVKFCQSKMGSLLLFSHFSQEIPELQQRTWEEDQRLTSPVWQQASMRLPPFADRSITPHSAPDWLDLG